MHEPVQGEERQVRRALVGAADRPSLPTQSGDDATALSVGVASTSAAPKRFSRSAVLGLQRAAGNRAVVRALQREPQPPQKDTDQGSPGSAQLPGGGGPIIVLSGGPQTTELDPTTGDPVKGYERPRATYSETDRQHFVDEVGQRRKDNTDNVVAFTTNFSKSVTSLWGTHLTEEMSRAAASKALLDWRSLTELFLEEALFTALGMGIGFLAEKTVATLLEDHIKRLLLEKTIEVFGEGSLKAGNEHAKQKLEQDEIEKTRAELDAKTKAVANIVPQMQGAIVGLLDIPWERYGAWIEKASPEKLAKFRLPKIFAPVDAGLIDTAAAGAIVMALHDSHTAEAPQRIGADPTEKDATSYFDDFQVISHLGAGGDATFTLTEQSTEIYVKNSSPLLAALVGKSIGQMGNVPLFVAIAPQDADVMDYVAGSSILEGISKEAAARYGSSIVVGGPAAIEEFKAAYPSRERELRITRAPKAEGKDGGDVDGAPTVRGGGLGEQFLLYRRAQSERWLIEQVTDALSDLLQRNYPRPDNAGGGDLPVRQAATAARKILEFWMVAGAERVIAEDVAKLKPQAPEDRWEKAYFKKGSRSQILKR
ncbi:MAG TPA: hypothetical protein VGM94_08590 [Galbitalea sp.]|jgi:hypothetical protein